MAWYSLYRATFETKPVQLEEKSAKKERILVRKRWFFWLVLVFSQVRKFHNVKAARSIVTYVLKQLS